jgi:acyl carrier protein
MDAEDFCRHMEQALFLEPHSTTPATPFADIPDFDSMSQVKILALVDELYDVQIPATAVPNIKSVRDMAPYVQRALAARANTDAR